MQFLGSSFFWPLTTYLCCKFVFSLQLVFFPDLSWIDLFLFQDKLYLWILDILSFPDFCCCSCSKKGPFSILCKDVLKVIWVCFASIVVMKGFFADIFFDLSVSVLFLSVDCLSTLPYLCAEKRCKSGTSSFRSSKSPLKTRLAASCRETWPSFRWRPSWAWIACVSWVWETQS